MKATQRAAARAKSIRARKEIEPPTEDHLMVALRLIKLRWDDLDFADKTEERGSHGVFFTAPQLHALANIAAERMKEQAQARKKGVTK